MTDHRVMAWDESGNRRVPTPIFPGDEIEWKRQGQAGTVRLKVEELWRNPAGELKVYARPIEGGRRLTIRKGIARVFDANGKRRKGEGK